MPMAAGMLGYAILIGIDGSYDLVEAATWLTLAVENARSDDWRGHVAAYARDAQSKLTPPQREAFQARLARWRSALDGRVMPVSTGAPLEAASAKARRQSGDVTGLRAMRPCRPVAPRGQCTRRGADDRRRRPICDRCGRPGQRTLFGEQVGGPGRDLVERDVFGRVDVTERAGEFGWTADIDDARRSGVFQ